MQSGTASKRRWGEHPSLTAFPLFLRGGFKGSQAEQETQPRSPGPKLWVCSRSGGTAPPEAVCTPRSPPGRLSPQGDHTQNKTSPVEPNPAGHELGAELLGTKTLGGVPSSRAGGTGGSPFWDMRNTREVAGERELEGGSARIQGPPVLAWI